eukprot:g2073.t1
MKREEEKLQEHLKRRLHQEDLRQAEQWVRKESLKLKNEVQSLAARQLGVPSPATPQELRKTVPSEERKFESESKNDDPVRVARLLYLKRKLMKDTEWRGIKREDINRVLDLLDREGRGTVSKSKMREIIQVDLAFPLSSDEVDDLATSFSAGISNGSGELLVNVWDFADWCSSFAYDENEGDKDEVDNKQVGIGNNNNNDIDELRHFREDGLYHDVRFTSAVEHSLFEQYGFLVAEDVVDQDFDCEEESFLPQKRTLGSMKVARLLDLAGLSGHEKGEKESKSSIEKLRKWQKSHKLPLSTRMDFKQCFDCASDIAATLVKTRSVEVSLSVTNKTHPLDDKIFIDAGKEGDKIVEEKVIPILNALRVSYFDCSSIYGTSNALSRQRTASESCKVHLYVIDGVNRGIDTMLQLSTQLGTNSEHKMVLVLDDIKESSDRKLRYNAKERAELNRARALLACYARTVGVPVFSFDAITKAVHEAVRLLDDDKNRVKEKSNSFNTIIHFNSNSHHSKFEVSRSEEKEVDENENKVEESKESQLTHWQKEHHRKVQRQKKAEKEERKEEKIRQKEEYYNHLTPDQRRVAILQDENARLEKELSAFDDDFFNEVDDLKFRYARCLKRNKKLVKDLNTAQEAADRQHEMDRRLWRHLESSLQESDHDLSGFLSCDSFRSILQGKLGLTQRECNEIIRSLPSNAFGQVSYLAFIELRRLLFVVEEKSREKERKGKGRENDPFYFSRKQNADDEDENVDLLPSIDHVLEKLESDYERKLWNGLSKNQLKQAAGEVSSDSKTPTVSQVPAAVLQRGLRRLVESEDLPLTSIECDTVVSSLKVEGRSRIGWVDVRKQDFRFQKEDPGTWSLLGVTQALGLKACKIVKGMDAITFMGMTVYQTAENLMGDGFGSIAFVLFTGISILPQKVMLSDVIVRACAALYLRARSRCFRDWVNEIASAHQLTWIACYFSGAWWGIFGSHSQCGRKR